ncbi:MAG: IS200/IS605 family transposase [Candidatus Diapherotrites archaeon]|nr:IS200/IS605 family transposase [Candidatus Diapherotrites archaeon]
MVEQFKLKKTNHATFNINYHIVFCPKYRKNILTGELKTFIENCFETITHSSDYELIELEVMPDHIHIFVSTKPDVSPLTIVKKLKGISALLIFKNFPETKTQLRKGHFWSPSYYISTAGVVTSEAIKKYIRANSPNQ